MNLRSGPKESRRKIEGRESTQELNNAIPSSDRKNDDKRFNLEKDRLPSPEIPDSEEESAEEDGGRGGGGGNGGVVKFKTLIK